MIPISPAVYELLLERAEDFKKVRSLQVVHLEDRLIVLMVMMCIFAFVVLHFVICCISIMSRLNAVKIQRDIVSQAITILQAINMKDKTNLLQYLCYCDRGFMYFPDIAFMPFLRSVDEIVKEVIDVNALLDYDGIINVNFI